MVGAHAHRLGRARPRSARLRPGAFRRRRPAAWLRAGRASGHQRRAGAAAPGVLCADGLLAADLKADFSRTLPRAGKVDIERRADLRRADRQADDWLAKEKVAPADRKQSRVALMRYHGQGGEVSVGWVDDAASVEAAFAAAHESLYGFMLDVADRARDLAHRGDGPHARTAAACAARRQRSDAARPSHRPFRFGNDRGATLRSCRAGRRRPHRRSRHHHAARRHDPDSARLVRRGSSLGRDPSKISLSGAGQSRKMVAIDRLGQAEVAAQSGGFVLGPEQAAALQLGDDHVDEVPQRPGSQAGMTLKPSAAPSLNQCSISSATCEGVPTESAWPRGPALARQSSQKVRLSRRACSSSRRWRLRGPLVSAISGTGPSSGSCPARAHRSCARGSRCRPASGSAIAGSRTSPVLPTPWAPPRDRSPASP